MPYQTIIVPVGLNSPTVSGGESDPMQGTLYADTEATTSATAYDFVEGDPSSRYVVPCVTY